MTTTQIIDFCRNSTHLTEEENAACSRICVNNDNGNEQNEKDLRLIEQAISNMTNQKDLAVTINFSFMGNHEVHSGTAIVVPNYNEGTIVALNALPGSMDNLTTRKIGNQDEYIIYENYYDPGSNDYLYFAIKED